MVETVKLRTFDGSPDVFVTRDVEPTATPGLYVAADPHDEEGWLIVAECGMWLSTAIRWKTPEAAHAVAADLAGGDPPFDWTRPRREVMADYEICTRLWQAAAAGREDDRYPLTWDDRPPPTKGRSSLVEG